MRDVLSPFIKLLGAIFVVAVLIRLSWELLAPALIPMSIVGLVLTLLLVAYRRR